MPVAARRDPFARALPRVRVAVLGLFVTLPSACGESKASGGGTGGAFAGAAGVVTASGGTGAFGGSSGAMSGAPSGGLANGGAAATAGASNGSCHQNGEQCADSRDCCANAVCNNTAGALALNGCHPICMQNADCSTGCCVPLTGSTRGICAEAMWCGCGMSGAACGSQLPACCGDQICLANDTTRASYACQKRCTTNADCPTKCCVAIPTLGMSACLDPMYCPAM
jgi:hypothetical protein